MPLDKKKDLVRLHHWGHREGLKQREKFRSLFDVAAGQFTDYKWMTDHLRIQQQFFKLATALPKVGNPNGGINDDHGRDYADLRLRMGRRSFSVPPSRARRLLLSRAISASSPRRTNRVFSFRPVSCDALSNNVSSMLSVVLICTSMHH